MDRDAAEVSIEGCVLERCPSLVIVMGQWIGRNSGAGCSFNINAEDVGCCAHPGDFGAGMVLTLNQDEFHIQGRQQIER